jgi:hypothetical protein
MTGALLSSVRRFQFPVSSPVPVEGIQSCGAEGILESFALSIGNHADDLEHSGHVMHEPDAIQLSLLDGFRRILAERVETGLLASAVNALSHTTGEQKGGVENRRRGVSLPVAHGAAFARVASIRLGLALFPVPAHRTEQARFAHSALGESVTRSPTEGWSSGY